METGEQIFIEINKKEYWYYCRDTNSMAVTSDYSVYQEAMIPYNFKKERYGMVGDRGVHFPKHDPPS